MFALLLLYAAFIALSTIGGLMFARTGSQPARLGSSAAGIVVCVFATTVATLAVTSSDLLASP